MLLRPHAVLETRDGSPNVHSTALEAPVEADPTTSEGARSACWWATLFPVSAVPRGSTLIEQARSARGPPTALYSSHVAACAHRCALKPRPLVLLSTPDTGTGSPPLSASRVTRTPSRARSLGPSRLRAPSYDSPGSAHASRARRYVDCKCPTPRVTPPALPERPCRRTTFSSSNSSSAAATYRGDSAAPSPCALL